MGKVDHGDFTSANVAMRSGSGATRFKRETLAHAAVYLMNREKETLRIYTSTISIQLGPK